MSTVAFLRDGTTLQGFDSGHGVPGHDVPRHSLPVLFQHGLGGSEAQVAENVPDLAGTRRLTLECRAQGNSSPGARRPFSVAMFASDALAFCDHLGVARFVAGGISMGAAIALHLAVRHPARVRGLILARPAWLFDPAPANMRPYAEVAAALRAAPPTEARRQFEVSETAALLAREAPDNLASLVGFFARPDPAVTAELLDDIAADGPGVTAEDVAALRIPTLVIGHAVDHAHPFAHAEALAAAIPGATLVRIPPKAVDRAAHVAAFRAAVTAFLAGLSPETELDR